MSKLNIYRGIPEKGKLNNPVVTIGTFDGIHRGHKKIISTVKEIAKKNNSDAVIITFAEHPKKVLNPDIICRVITTNEEKINAIHNSGINNIILLDFTTEISNMNASDFYHNIIIDQIGAKQIIIGYDHAFGKNREGNIDFLKELSQSTGVEIIEVSEELNHSKIVSSTWLRNEIEDGSIRVVNELLGRKYSIFGNVISGKKRGRKLGFPTANILPDNKEKLLPADGVYAVKIYLNELKMEGMANIGFNPTFEGYKKSIEINIFDFDADIYDSNLKVEFHKKIRVEKKFNSPEDLINQIKKDKIEIEKYFKNYKE